VEVGEDIKLDKNKCKISHAMEMKYEIWKKEKENGK